MEAAFVNIDLKLPRGASLGLYARRNALPTHTNYDIMEVVKGNEEKTRTSRAIKVSILDQGTSKKLYIPKIITY